MKVKEILVNTIWYGVIPKLSTVINVLLLPFITPYVTLFDYGVYGVLTSYTGIVTLIAVLGLNIHLTNSYYVYKNNFRKVWGRILFILLLSGTFCAVVYGFIISMVLTDVSGIVKFIAILGSCIPVALIANTTLAQHYYTLTYKPKPLVIRNLLASLLGICVTFVSIYYFKLGFLGWIFGVSTSAIATFCLFIHPIWINEQIKPIVCYDFKRIKNWLTISLPIIPHSIGFVLLSSSDRIIMNLLGVPMSDIGLYSNGYIMGDYTIIITSAMIVAIAPRINELYRASNYKALKNLYLFCQSFTISIVVLVSIWMPEIYHLLIHNPELYPANRIATLICFANIAFPFYSFVSTVVFVREDTKKVLWLIFIPGAVNIILNLIFIPIYGYKAAIYTTIIAYWTMLLIPYIIKYFGEINIQVFGVRYVPMLLLIIFGGFLYVAYYVSMWNVVSKIVITLVIIGICLGMMVKHKRQTF